LEYDKQKIKAKEKADEIADEIIKEYGRLSGDRFNFESHWQEIAERMVPSHSRQFNSQDQSLYTQGEKRTEHIFDSTAAIALTRFAAILDSLLTPRNQMWHRVLASEPELNKDHEVKKWFEQLNRILFKYRYAPLANFASQNQQNYKSLGAYGTGCVFIDGLDGAIGLRYKNIHLSQIYFSETHQGIVDKALRYFPFTARQAAQKWGADNLPPQIKNALDQNSERKFFFIHCVKPRTDLVYGRKDFKGMKYASYYVSMDGKTVMGEGGYNTFPYAISRYEQAENEVYGRSPAMDVLPAVKTLNEEKKAILKQGHRALDPIVLAHDDGVADAFSWKPGTVVSGGVSADGRPMLQTLQTGQLQIGKELMDDERAVINDAFLITIFQILTETPTMTATEVAERAREKGILLAPTIGRQQSEYLGPMIDREIDVLMRQGLIPPMPQGLREAKGDYRVEYDSPLSRAARAEEVAGVMRTLESAINVATATGDPSQLDYFDFDIIIPAMAEIQAVPPSWMRAQKDVDEIRAGRAQQAQQEQMINAAPGAAAIVKAASVAKKSGAI